MALKLFDDCDRGMFDFEEMFASVVVESPMFALKSDLTHLLIT
jgi:hypothetical protein